MISVRPSFLPFHLWEPKSSVVDVKDLQVSYTMSVILDVTTLCSSVHFINFILSFTSDQWLGLVGGSLACFCFKEVIFIPLLCTIFCSGVWTLTPSLCLISICKVAWCPHTPGCLYCAHLLNWLLGTEAPALSDCFWQQLLIIIYAVGIFFSS